MAFRLIVTVKRGVASDLPEASMRFQTLEAARSAAASLMREDVVSRIMIASDEEPPHFIEWAA